MELIEVTPSSKTFLIVGVYRSSHKFIRDVHGDLAKVFTHTLQNDTDYTGIRLDIGMVVEQVEGAGAVKLQRRCYTLCLRLRLPQQLLVQILQQRHFAAADPQRQLPVHQPHTAVNDRLFNGLQALLAADDQLTQGKQKIGFHGQWTILVIDTHLNIHGVDMVGTVRGNFNDLSSQALDQRGVFAHRVNHHNAVFGGEEHIDKLSLCRKGLAGACGAKVQTVGRFQLFAVCHNDIVGKSVHTVVQGLSIHPKLTGHKGNENRRGACGHTSLDLNTVIAQHQRGNESLLLLPVQPLDGTVVFLCDARNGEHIVFQTLLCGSEVYYRKGQQEHSLVPGLQVGQQFSGVLGKGNEVGRKNVHIISCPDSLFLFFHLHAANIADLALHRLNCLELIHSLNVHGDGEFRIQFQDFSQQLIRKLRR